MKIRTKYLLFVCIVHATALLLSYFIFEQQKLLFLVAEVVILVSVLIAWQLYNQMMRPLQLLVEGAKAIKDRDFTVKLVEVGMEEMDQLIVVYNQMIEELRKERTHQQQQHFFLEKLLFNSPVGIIILDHDKRIQLVNPAAKNLLHTVSVQGWLLSDIDHPIFNEIRNLLQRKEQSFILQGAESYKIQVSAFIDQGFPRHFILIQEITAELLHAEKMAYGKVIRMMAHEVNNTIGPVNSILQSAYNLQPEEEQKSSLANALQVAIDRNNNLNKFMRNLADVVRLPEPSKQLLNVHELIDHVVILLTETVRTKGISFCFDYTPVPLQIFADQLQMEQVIINIVKNAIEAIGGQGGGKITFETGHSPKKLVIRDSGKGIDAAAQPNLFSPFFSTKSDGQGIGLTLIKDVMVKHGFQFNLAADGNGETAFTITCI
jgi:two-component system nitrogen regulation sensor histidine kinase NtrY